MYLKMFTKWINWLGKFFKTPFAGMNQAGSVPLIIALGFSTIAAISIKTLHSKTDASQQGKNIAVKSLSFQLANETALE